MSLTLAIMIHATAVVIDFSKSLASRRLRLIQARVRSTTQRRGSNTKPLATSDRLTMSIVHLPSGTSDCSSFSPALDLLAGVEAARTTRLGGFDRLTIDHPGRRARLAPSHLARRHQQVMVDQFPPSIVPPLVEITLYGRKRRKVLGEHPPLATRFNDVEYGIKHRTLVSRGRPTRNLAGMCGSISAHSSSVVSLAYRSPSRRYLMRVISVHDIFGSPSLTPRQNHKWLESLNSIFGQPLRFLTPGAIGRETSRFSALKPMKS